MAATATLDLASVTDALIAGLADAVEDSPLWTGNGGTSTRFTIKVSGLPLDLARGEQDTQIAIALLHVGPHISYRNRTQRGPDGLTVPLAPAALTLTYAVSCFSGKDYVSEQQAMGIALSWIMAHPIQRFAVAGTPPRQVEYSMTLEPAPLDDIARLWQSMTGPMRLTAIIKVGAVFLGPDEPVVTPNPNPTHIGLAATPADMGATSPRLLTASEAVQMPDGIPRAPLSPGETTIVAGLGLNSTDRLHLSPADDSASFDVTNWVSQRTANTLHLKLPLAGGVPPAGAPAPGLYRLRIGTPLTGPSIPLEIGS